MKFYAVKNGRTTGIFDNWTECNASISGFSGAVYKSFNSKEEAEAYLSDKDLWDDIVAEDIRQGYIVAFCDGSYDDSLNRYSYGVIVRFLYKGIIIKHNKTEPTYTKTSLFLCEKRRFFMGRTEKGGKVF